MENQGPKFDVSSVYPVPKQSPGLAPPQNGMPNPIAQQTDPNDEKRQQAIKKIRKRGIAGLVLGVLVLVGLFLPFIVFGGNSDSPAAGALVYLVYAPFYVFLMLGGIIACVILLILTLVDMKKYKIKFSKYVVMIIGGLLLTFSPYIYSAIYSAIRGTIVASDPFKITTAWLSISDCQTSAERASNKNWSDVDSLGGDPEYIAEDVACSYLEYFYDNGVEPSSGAQLSQYYQSYNAKNGIAEITINAEQPDKANVYNIITHRSCEYDDTNNDSAISVWFRDEERNNGIGCTDLTAGEYLKSKQIIRHWNLYDLEQSREWFEEQFDDEMSSNEK